MLKKGRRHLYCTDDFLRTLVYTMSMRKAPLTKTDPYLKNPAKRERVLQLP